MKSAMSALHSGHLGGLLLLIGGVALSLAAIRERVRRLRRVAGFLEADGRVVEVERRDDPAFAGDYLYVMRVSFVAASGEAVAVTLSRRDGRVPRVGDQIPILYPAGDPARGEAEGWSALQSAGGLAMAVMLAVLGAFLLYASLESH